jgi:heptosyltransferase-2/heptosyltransferase-3
VKQQVRNRALPLAARLSRRPAAATEDTILILQPDHLGDILLSQPAVRIVRAQHPTSRLIAVVGPWSREIAQLAWPVDEVVAISYPGFTRAGKASRVEPYRRLFAEASRLADYRARSAYVLRPDAWWAAWLASLAAPEVVTSDDPRCTPFATRFANISNTDHASVRAMHIAALGTTPPETDPAESPLTLELPGSAVDDARRILTERGIGDRYVVIHPGSGAAVKEWPVHRWAAVARELSEDGLDIVLTGTDAEAPLCNAIRDHYDHARSLAGLTPIPVLAAVLQKASLVLGPDCGPLHLAVAVGTPTLHLFGPSNPQRYGPWGDPGRHRVLRAGWNCPKCGDLSAARPAGCGCMLAIDADSVVDTARALLANHAS